MGGQQSQKRDDTISIIRNYSLQRKNSISQKEFTVEIFKILDGQPKHTTAGPIIFTQSYVLKAFYDHLKDERKGYLAKDKFIDVIEQIFDKPERAIEYSQRIITPDRQKISKRQFSNFIQNCLNHGIQVILKRKQFDASFIKSFKDWMNVNKTQISQGIDEVFINGKQNSSEYWNVGDFKRWILDNNHWTLQIQIKDTVYKIPLNIPCLFGIILVKKKEK